MQLNIKFQKNRFWVVRSSNRFWGVFVKIDLPQNFCHRHTDRQTFSINSRVQDIPKHINPLKSGNQKFLRKLYFFSVYIKESNNNNNNNNNKSNNKDASIGTTSDLLPRLLFFIEISFYFLIYLMLSLNLDYYEQTL